MKIRQPSLKEVRQARTAFLDARDKYGPHDHRTHFAEIRYKDLKYLRDNWKLDQQYFQGLKKR